MIRSLIVCAAAAISAAGLSAASLSAFAQTGMLAVVNQKEHTVLLVDPVEGKAVASLSVGINGHECASSPDGRTVYVPIYSNVGVGHQGTAGRTIEVIDVATWTRKPTIDLGSEVRPHKDVFGPDGLLYVTAELHNAVDIVDVKQQKVVGEVPTGQPESHIVAVAADGRRAYTANVGPGSVSVLDLDQRKLVKVIPLTKHVQRMALSIDGRWAFTSDADQPRLAVVDTRTNELSRWVPTTGTPYVTQPTPDGKWLLVAETEGTKGLLEVFDLATWKPVRSFPLPSPQNGGFVFHGDHAYLSEPQAGRIERLNAGPGGPASWTMEPPIVLTIGVDGLAWVKR